MTELVIIGEAYGEEEARQNRPFVGGSGRLLNWLLSSNGINRKEAHVTNVFNLRPPGGNDIKNICGSRSEGIPGSNPLVKGKYVLNDYADELERLDYEIATHRPNLCLLLGSTAAWAATGKAGIRKLRGYAMWSERWNCKVLATYHPHAVRKQWDLNPIVHADLRKAAREMQFPALKRPNHEVWIEPTLEDLLTFEHQHIIPNRRRPLSVDIETQAGQITCIGFAPTPAVALVLPFVDWTKPGNNYFPTLAEEVTAYYWAKRILESATSVVGQNFGYDVKYLYKYNIHVPGYDHDTMLLSHAQQPELEKGLNFLASVHTDEASWKFMRTDTKTLKMED